MDCRELVIARVPFNGPTKRTEYQCVGPGAIKYLMRTNPRYSRTATSIDGAVKEDNEKKIEIHIDIEYLRSLDPKEWKDQDHYAVLGLKNVRFNASEDDLKRAYRKIVLKHHPDKRKALGEEIKQDDDYFTCITRAYEILGTPIKRRSYDSVDPEFDDALPTTAEIERDFFAIFEKYFLLNARWSEKKNVPKIGGETATREQVEHFYSFWYNFESWREYSYLDEEDKEKGQDREERRWIEKQNKSIRAKRKKEEMTRIRALVDLAYGADPRIGRFKREEKDKKQAAKRAKQDAVQAQRADEERVLREAREASQRHAQAEQKRIEAIRLERELQKRALKRERKTFRETVKACDYYADKAGDDRVRHMEGVEKICECLKMLELQELNQSLVSGGRDVFVRTLRETEAKLEAERRALFKTAAPATTATAAADSANTLLANALKAVDRQSLWQNENMQLLIKAVNLFPAGTVQRWEVIANFMNQHGTAVSDDNRFSARDVLNKAKNLQSGDFSKSVLKTAANQNAFDTFEKAKRDLKVADVVEISVSLDEDKQKKETTTVSGGERKKSMSRPKENGIASHESSPAPKKTTTTATTNAISATSVPASASVTTNGHTNKMQAPPAASPAVVKAATPTPAATAAATTTTTTTATAASNVWTKDEQSLLEQAIKTYPITTADRWDRIAECIPNRTRKECLRRVKELVDRVNAKREAQAIVK